MSSRRKTSTPRRAARPRATRNEAEQRQARAISTGRALNRRGGGGRGPESRELSGAVFGCVVVLAGLGMVMVFSATAPLSAGASIPPYFLRHATAVLVGGVLAGQQLNVGGIQRRVLPDQVRCHGTGALHADPCLAHTMVGEIDDAHPGDALRLLP